MLLERTLIENEPVMLFKNGKRFTGKLAFYPSTITSIAAFNEGNTIETVRQPYSLDRDPSGTGATITFEGGSLPFLERNDLFQPPSAPNAYPSARDKTRWMLFSENGLFHKRQLLVTYEHEGAWHGYIPPRDQKRLPIVKVAMQEGKPLDVLVFGDSISTGADCTLKIGLHPFAPGYGELLARGITTRHPRVKVHLVNASVGGQSSEWGKKQIKNILNQERDFGFDLNVIAWGANDAAGKRKPARFVKNVEDHLKAIVKKHPRAEFILVASSLTNPAWIHSSHEHLHAYRDGLLQLREKWGSKVEVADMTMLWGDLLKRKDFYDLTGNGLNHPNDWGHRLYADVLLDILDFGSI